MTEDTEINLGVVGIIIMLAFVVVVMSLSAIVIANNASETSNLVENTTVEPSPTPSSTPFQTALWPTLDITHNATRNITITSCRKAVLKPEVNITEVSPEYIKLTKSINESGMWVCEEPVGFNDTWMISGNYAVVIHRSQ